MIDPRALLETSGNTAKRHPGYRGRPRPKPTKPNGGPLKS